MWLWADIKRDWLPVGALIATDQDICAAFERVERDLGEAWLTSRRPSSPAPRVTWQVVRMGQMLMSLEGVMRAEALITKIRRGDLSAESELTALHFVRSILPGVEAEYEPAADGRRKADLRVRLLGEPWSYVEVTRPMTSAETDAIWQALQEVTDVLGASSSPPALKIFFRREPAARDANDLAARLRSASSRLPYQRIDTPALVAVFSDGPMDALPGAEIVDEEGQSRLSITRTDWDPRTKCAKQIVASFPFVDRRIIRIFKHKARQLPKGSPGMVVIDPHGLAGGPRTWAAILRPHLLPSTRAGGACFPIDFVAIGPPGHPVDYAQGGLGSNLVASLVTNPHARHPLPTWIVGGCAPV
jgi:hypothetical protein